MRVLFVILALFVFSLDAKADGIAIGFLEDGYTYQGNSIWGKDGNYYTRSKIITRGAGYYSCGYYYPGRDTYYYSYSLTSYTAPALPAAPKYSVGWKEQALKYAEARDDYAAYLQTMKVLGINGQQLFSGTLISGSPYAQAYSSSIYTGGNTLYNYGLKETAQLYGELDLNRLFQNEARAGQDARAYGNEASARGSSLLSQVTTAFAESDKLRAEYDGRARLILSSRPPSSARIETTVTGTGVAPARPMPKVGADWMSAPLQTEVSQKLQAYIQTSCVSCHSPNGERPQTDLTSPASASFAIRSTSTLLVAGGEMPKNGTPAPDDVLKEFQAWTAVGRKAASALPR